MTTTNLVVTVDTPATEELRDVLESNAWDTIRDIVAADAIESRRALLTAINLTESQRMMHLAKLKTYLYLFQQIYKCAGLKTFPSKYLELFTGSETN